MTMTTGRALPPKKKAVPASHPQKKKPLAKLPAVRGSTGNNPAIVRGPAASIHQIRLMAQHELAMARKMRADAERYQIETENKARSQAQQLLLHTRLTTQKEIGELVSKASAEIQKMLADIRVIRITAQEELSAQKKFTDAARIASLSLNLNNREPAAPAPAEPKRKPVIIRQ